MERLDDRAARLGTGIGEPVASSGDASVKKRELRGQVISASLWVVGGHAYNRLTHLGSSLILTRVLFPEAFGVMAIVTAVVQGMELLSDVGVGASIVQNDRGREPDFLRTAWTIQVIRGLVLWTCASLLAWPLAHTYDVPSLAQLIPVSALTAVLAGLNSTTFFSWRRQLNLRKLTLIEAFCGTVGVVVTIALAWAWRNVWALAVGGLATTAIKLCLGHFLSDDPPMRFRWDARAAHSIYRFGRWIFLSTVLTFLTGQGDRLVLGGFLSMEDLGRYSIAALIMRSILQTNNILSRRVLFPLYSRIGRENTPVLRRQTGRIRLAIMGAMMPPLWLLAILGDRVIGFLYDPRYAEAGWMLQILATGALFLVVGTVGPIHMARGETWIGLVATAVRGAVLLIGMIIGGWIWGSEGLIVAIASSYAVYYPLQVWISRRYDVWIPLYDVLGIGSSILVIGAGLYLF